MAAHSQTRRLLKQTITLPPYTMHVCIPSRADSMSHALSAAACSMQLNNEVQYPSQHVCTVPLTTCVCYMHQLLDQPSPPSPPSLHSLGTYLPTTLPHPSAHSTQHTRPQHAEGMAPACCTTVQPAESPAATQPTEGPGQAIQHPTLVLGFKALNPVAGSSAQHPYPPPSTSTAGTSHQLQQQYWYSPTPNRVSTKKWGVMFDPYSPVAGSSAQQAHPSSSSTVGPATSSVNITPRNTTLWQKAAAAAAADGMVSAGVWQSNSHTLAGQDG
jgi:hypothetical protein